MLGDADQQLEHDQVEAERDDADGEEARRLEAGVALAWRSNVQWRFQRKLLVTATQKASDRGEDVVHVDALDERREDGQVDDVAARADGRELDELDPVGGLAQAAADTQSVVACAGRKRGFALHCPQDSRPTVRSAGQRVTHREFAFAARLLDRDVDALHARAGRPHAE